MDIEVLMRYNWFDRNLMMYHVYSTAASIVVSSATSSSTTTGFHVAGDAASGMSSPPPPQAPTQPYAQAAAAPPPAAAAAAAASASSHATQNKGRDLFYGSTSVQPHPPLFVSLCVKHLHLFKGTAGLCCFICVELSVQKRWRPWSCSVLKKGDLRIPSVLFQDLIRE
jgi:hypothetical protein